MAKPSQRNFPGFTRSLTMPDMTATLDLPLALAPPSAPSPRAVLDAGQKLTAWLAERGQRPLRVKQIRRQIIANRAESFAAMTDLPLGPRQAINRGWAPLGTQIERHLQSADGTQKLLLKLHDGRLIECVMIP